MSYHYGPIRLEATHRTVEDGTIQIIRRTVRGALTASLGTLGRTTPSGPGAPYVSLVQVATRIDGAPLLLLSTLAEHTQNAQADARASLLLDGTQGLGRPLTGPRVTLQGTLAETADPAARRRYLARHPEAAEYVGFADFAIYLFEPESAHLVAGFGKIEWVAWTDIATPPNPEGDLAEAEEAIVDHLNEAHPDIVAALVAQDGGPPGPWQVTGCDPEGCDLRLGAESRRIEFDRPVASREEVRAALAGRAGTIAAG